MYAEIQEHRCACEQCGYRASKTLRKSHSQGLGEGYEHKYQRNVVCYKRSSARYAQAEVRLYCEYIVRGRHIRLEKSFHLFPPEGACYYLQPTPRAGIVFFRNPRVRDTP